MRKVAILVAIVAAGLAGALWFDLPARLGFAREPRQAVLYGNVDIRQVSLGFRVSGRIAELRVDEGDSVKAGDVIAKLDAEPFRQAVGAAEAEAEVTRATLAKLRAGARAAEIAQARATHEERLAELENAKLAFERAKQLRPNGTISQAELDQANASRAAADARARSAREAPAFRRGKPRRGHSGGSGPGECRDGKGRQRPHLARGHPTCRPERRRHSLARA